MGWRRDRFPVVSPLCVVVGIAGAIVFIGSGFVSIIVYASRAAGRTSCSHWGQQTGYPTKFRVLYWADTGTCLAQTPNGHWVKNTQVFINVPEQSK